MKRVWNSGGEIGRVGGQRLGGLLGYQEAADGVAGLCTASKPVLDPFGIQLNCCRFLEWVVGSHNLRETAVAGTPLIDHHDSITRHLLLAISSQADSEHSEIPPYVIVSRKYGFSNAAFGGLVRRAENRRTPHR